ncbi:hypothetical protein [Pontibacter oryzae]|uniref:Uncharacterized protein n=1 Tax=Pontibacter oryzae TaxID=2304593 RepID=A0A399RVH3_9BACT|nr:hypothetical protein [Pontibacter oryzae]RIJ33415.1 hypothetical protein D1627_17500 [Pontibacter oryzae]
MLLSLPILAQAPLSNKRCKWIIVNSLPQQLDSLTLLPSSVTFQHPKKEQFRFDYNYTSNEFRLTAFPAPDSVATDTLGTMRAQRDSVLVCFRVMPLSLAQPAFKRDITKLELKQSGSGFLQENINTKEEIFRTPGLNKTGSISRGVSFGNTQNVFVNSALNLQLDGKLTDDISITAAITDQNIPFQPEGNTQQLQEFDKVYITLRHRLWQLTAGDVVLKSKPSYFMQFYKNVQGGAFTYKLGEDPKRQGVTTVAASVSKGKFASQIVKPQEGVLGPYRLRGPNNELYIIVLANSERVFLDGVLLQRGYDYDYVIDYNQAEITFTTNHVITKNSRIKVDFEYSDQNYSRGIYHLSHYQNLDKLQVYANYYNESDNPNSLLNLNLNAEQKRLLASVGDSLQLAIASGADSVAFDPAQVLYARRDTVYNSGQSMDRVYVYSNDPEQAHYSVSFTNVGSGNGDYVAINGTVNGRAYRWVAPVNGQRQGSYAPVRVLPTPKKKQLITFGGNYELQKGISFFAEGAASEYDINRFSDLDAQDDNGKGLRVGYVVKEKELAFLGKYKLNSTLNYEYADEFFEPIDRYRPIEFDRDWSLTTTEKAEDHIFNFSVGASQDLNNLFNYRMSRRYRQDQLDGVQHYLDAIKTLDRLTSRNHFFMLRSTQGERESEWYRGDMNLEYKLGKVAPGYVYSFDKNRITALNTDSVIGSAQYFEQHMVYLQSGDTATTRFRVDYSYRTDNFATQEGTLGNKEVGQTYNASLQTRLNPNNDLAILATYRKLSVRNGKDEETIQSRVDWNGSFADGSFKSELSYATGTGRELKRIYIFQETLPGQGTHYLREGGDPNNLNDYLEAQTVDQRRYIKIYLPTDEYINAYTNTFSYRLITSAPRNWRQAPGIKATLSNFSMLTSVSINKKTTDDNLAQRFNPFSQDVEDQFLISLVKQLRHTVYFKRSDPKYGLEYTVQQNEQKQLLNNGTETRNVLNHTAIGRLNLNEVLSSQLSAGYNVRENQSSFLSSKNFKIQAQELSPELAYQPNTKLRFTGKYQYSLKKDVLESAEQSQEAVFHELGLETKLNQVGKRTLSGNIKYVNIAFEGVQTSYVGYEILNALRPGNNMTWSLVMQQRLSNGLNISFNYDGRKANGVGAVHTGRTQVSVLF